MNREYLKARCFEDKDENWWERRTGMERCMFVFLIITVTFSVGCITFETLQFLLREEYCTSAICISEALKLASHIKDGIDPCENFFQYSCDNVSKFVNLEHTVKDKMNLLVQEPVSEDDTDAIKKEKQLFMACMGEADGKRSIRTIKEMLNEIGGWPVVVGYRWRARLFEWTDAVYVLRSRGFPFSMFFSIALAETKIIVSSPIETHLGYNKDLYRNFMTDTAVAFGADRYQAQLQMEDVLVFAEELRNITKEKINKSNKAEELFSTELSVDELQKMYDEIQWIDFFNNIFYPIATISSTDIVVIPSHEYLDSMLDLLASTPKRVQSNYLVWKVIEEMTHFLSKDLQELKGNYTCQTGGKLSYDRKDLCTQFLDSVFYVRPLQILVLSSDLSTEVKIKVTEIIGSVKLELITVFQNSDFDESSIENSIKFINSIEDIIGLPESIFNQSLFNDMSLENEEEIFKTILDAQKLYSDTVYAVNYQTNNTTDLYNLIKSVDVLYSKVSKAIVIPTIFVQEFYKAEQPMYLNYANVGTVYANVLVQAVIENAEELWSTSTVQMFQNQTDCLSVEETVIARQISINLVYKTYKKWSEDAKEPKLIGMSQTPVQLFWITAVLKNCPVFQNTKEILLNQHFINDFKCSDLLINSNNCDGL